MKIAVLSTVPVLPPIAGNRSRVLAFIRALQKIGHDVYFIYLPSVMTDLPDDAAHISDFGAERYIRLPMDELRSYSYLGRRFAFRLKRKLFRTVVGGDMGYYHNLDEYYAPGLTSRLRNLQKAHGFDAVVCEYLFHSAALDAFPSNVLKILDTHDTFSDRHRLFPGIDTYWFSVPPSEQARAFRRADVVVAIQEAEGDLFRQQLGADASRVVVVSHMLELGSPVTDFSSPHALFIGSRNEANIAAMKFFIEAVLPLIRRDIPDFRLLIAGSICLGVDDMPGVERLGIVANLHDVFVRAPVLMNPMSIGTGINIKLLEAMAAGVATVSTETGSRGLGDQYGNGVITVRDGDAKAFAKAVVDLARSEELRRVKGELAYNDAVAWNKAQTEVLRDALARRPS